MQGDALSAVDLEIQVALQTISGQQVLQYAVSSPNGTVQLSHRDIPPHPLGLLGEYRDRLIQWIENYQQRLHADGSAMLEEEAEAELRSLGNELYEQLFPSVMRLLYRQWRGKVRTLQITSGEVWIPWELVRPYDHHLTPVIDDDFLGARYEMTRWLPTGNSPARGIGVERLACIEAGRGGGPYLPAAEREKRFLEDFARSARVEVVSPKEATFPNVLALIEGGEADLLHFVGHGEFSSKHPEDSKIHLIDGVSLSARRLRGPVLQKVWERRPLVFFNACSTGQQGWALTGPSGWVQAWVGTGGAGAFIAPQWSVRDAQAFELARVFYLGLGQGRTLGQAARLARWWARRKNRRDSTWLAFAVYGHPNARVTFGPGAAESRVQIDQELPEITGMSHSLSWTGDPAWVDSDEHAEPGSLRQELDRRFPRLHSTLVMLHLLPKSPERRVLCEIGLRQLTEWEDQLETPFLDLRAEAMPVTNRSTENAAREDDPFHRTIQHDLRRRLGLPADSDVPEGVRTTGPRRRTATEILPLLLKKQGPIVLLGPPGSGKTQVMLKAACELTAAEQRRVYPSLVVFARLGEFHVRGRKPKPGDVEELVRCFCPPELRSDAARSHRLTFEGLWKSGRLIVLFDGLDEMSREGYDEHVHALILFTSDLGKRGGRCLFTCRVDDFPSMPYPRLALVPLDGPQIDRYLRRQFPDRQTFAVRREHWKPGRLARFLADGSPRLEAGIPLNLSLVSKVLKTSDVLPTSRAELLEQYFKSRYESRKWEAEKAEQPNLPSDQEAFHTWSRFAWWISERNLGTMIDVESLREDRAGADEEALEEAIRAGTLCGVLLETWGGKTHQIRFRHQQYQEYFAARWIYKQEVGIDWSTKLDDPRWQETLFDLAILGGGEDGLAALAETIDRETAAQREAVARETQEGGQEPPLKKPPSAVAAALADRVVLGARLVQQLGAHSTADRLLGPPLRSAAEHLLLQGDPSTQGKMLQAYRALRDSDPALDDPALETAVRAAERSPVRYVRDKAVQFTTDLPGEIGIDLATSELVRRFRLFLQAAYAGGDTRDWMALLVATLLGGAHLAAMLGLSLTLSWACIQGLAGWEGEVADPPVLLQLGSLGLHGFFLGQAVLTLGSLGFALVTRPRRAWLWCFGTVPVGCAIGYVVLAMSQSTLSMSQSVDAIGLAELMVLLLAIGLPGAAVAWALLHLAVLTLYSLFVPRRPGRPGFSELAKIAWRDCGYGATISGFFLLVLVCLILGGGKAVAAWLGELVGKLIWALGEGLYSLCSWIASGLQTIPGGPLPVLLATLSLFAISLLHPGVRQRLGRVIRGLAGLAGAAGCFLVAGAFIVFGEPLLDPVFEWIQWVWAHIPGRQHVRQAVLLVVLVLIVRASLPRLVNWLRRVLLPSEPPAPRSWTPEAWKAELEAAAPSEQETLLRVEPRSLRLSARAFMHLIREVYPSIKEQAQYAYLQRRDEIERAAQQERPGSKLDGSTLDPP
jgi:CHAT domain/NACHT domain